MNELGDVGLSINLKRIKESVNYMGLRANLLLYNFWTKDVLMIFNWQSILIKNKITKNT